MHDTRRFFLDLWLAASIGYSANVYRVLQRQRRRRACGAESRLVFTTLLVPPPRSLPAHSPQPSTPHLHSRDHRTRSTRTNRPSIANARQSYEYTHPTSCQCVPRRLHPLARSIPSESSLAPPTQKSPSTRAIEFRTALLPFPTWPVFPVRSLPAAGMVVARPGTSKQLGVRARLHVSRRTHAAFPASSIPRRGFPPAVGVPVWPINLRWWEGCCRGASEM